MHMVLKGLNELHSKGIVHRVKNKKCNFQDIKPTNILIDSKGVVKLGDFGLAIGVDQKDGQGNFPIEGFTTWYKPPEVLFGVRNYGTEFDMWSFACVMGEVLNGAPLFPGANDFQQLSKFSTIIGSPTPSNWPEIVKTPNFDKISFEEVKPMDMMELFLDSSKNEVNVLERTLRYQDRASAGQMLKSQYFQEYPPPLVKLLQEETYGEVETEKYEDIFGIKQEK